MKRIVLLAFLIVHGNGYSLQQDQRDSLLTALPQARGTERIKLLLRLGAIYRKDSISRSIAFTRQAIRYAGDEPDVRLELSSRIALSELYFATGQLDSSIVMLNDALDRAEGVKDSLGMAEVLRELSSANRLIGNYVLAADLMYRSLQISDRLGESNDVVSKLIDLGIIHMHEGNYAKAEGQFLEAEGRYTGGDSVLLARLTSNIALSLRQQKKFEPSLDRYLDARELYAALRMHGEEMNTLRSLGGVHASLHEHDRALHYFFRVLAGSKENLPLEAAVYCDIASTYLELKDYSDAERYAQQGAAAADKMKSLRIRNRAVGILALVYEGKKDFEKAFIFFREHKLLSDSLLNDEKSRQLKELQVRYETAKKENEIIELEMINHRQRVTRNLLAVSLVGFVAIGGLVVYVYVLRSRKQRVLLMTRKKLAEQELENLRIEEEELRREIDIKERALASYNIYLLKKNHLLDQLKNKVETLSERRSPIDQGNDLKNVSKILEEFNNVDKEWETFKLTFENVHSTFFHKLRTLYPDLTNAELKLCALMKMNINLKEASRILGVAVDSIKTSRYRIRRKMGLKRGDNLVDMIMRIDTEEIIDPLPNAAQSESPL